MIYAFFCEKKPSCEGFLFADAVQASVSLTAFFGALARVLFATGGNATLQADLLATACGGQGHTGQGLGSGGGFAVCVGDDFVAHGES